MKSSLFLLSVFFCSSIFANPTLLAEAILSNTVSVKIVGNDNSTHYLSPLTLTAKNNTSRKSEFVIPLGTEFIASDESYQNFISTEQQILALAPNQSVTLPIKAMCIESSDMAPGDEIQFSIGNSANKEVMKLLKFVDENDFREPEAQFLLWDIVDGEVHESMDSFGLTPYNTIAIFKKSESNEFIALNPVEDVYQEPLPTLSVYGSFTMNLGSEKNIHIAMFNKDNVLVKELYKNPRCTKGVRELEYSFNSLEFQEDLYYVKLVMNDEVMLNREIRMN